MDIYVEMYSGVAGDMLIGALLDLGASKEKLEKAVKSLFKNSNELFELKYDKVVKNTIKAYKFDVKLKENEESKEHHIHIENNHDEHSYEHCHSHTHYEYSHEHSHEHHHHDINTINNIIDSGDFSQTVKYNAKKIFDIIANSESISHGVKKEEVHFHEVGAIDSIIDIVGVCVLLEDLGAQNIYTSSLYDGIGIQNTMHGAMPVPVPAVLNIIQSEKLKLNIINEKGEHITPTGAAIISYFRTNDELKDFEIKNIGIGAGTKDFEKTTNVVRIMQIENTKKKL